MTSLIPTFTARVKMATEVFSPSSFEEFDKHRILRGFYMYDNWIVLFDILHIFFSSSVEIISKGSFGAK